MDNLYVPKVVSIEGISKETPDIKTLSLKYAPPFEPGQFLEISYFGLGEAPISISSSPSEKFVKISFKSVGKVTDALSGLKKGDFIGVRGPFGKGFPLNLLEGKDLIFIAGGVGMAPLRSLIELILYKKSGAFGRMLLIYGSRTPKDLLFKEDLEKWKKRFNVLITVDAPDSAWKGHVGVVTKLLEDVKLNCASAKAIVCGPPIMMRFVTEMLIERGMKPSDVILSLERYMKCGMGKCGHCYVADRFVCRDGPVFTYEDLGMLIPEESL